MKKILREKYKRLRKQEKILTIASSIGFIVLVCLVSVFSCGITNSHSKELRGIWNYDDHMSFAFEEKGNGYMSLGDLQYEYTYKVRKNRLVLDFTDETVRDCVYKFDIKGNSLILVGGEGTTGGTYQLYRRQ